MSSRRPGLQHQASSSDWDMLGQGSDSGQQLTAAHASSSLNAAGLQAGSGHALLQPSPDTVARLARHAAATQPQSWCQGSEPGGGLGGVPLSAVQEEGGPGSSSRLRALPWGPSHSLALLQQRSLQPPQPPPGSAGPARPPAPAPPTSGLPDPTLAGGPSAQCRHSCPPAPRRPPAPDRFDIRTALQRFTESARGSQAGPDLSPAPLAARHQPAWHELDAPPEGPQGAPAAATSLGGRSSFELAAMCAAAFLAGRSSMEVARSSGPWAPRLGLDTRRVVASGHIILGTGTHSTGSHSFLAQGGQQAAGSDLTRGVAAGPPGLLRSQPSSPALKTPHSTGEDAWDNSAGALRLQAMAEFRVEPAPSLPASPPSFQQRATADQGAAQPAANSGSLMTGSGEEEQHEEVTKMGSTPAAAVPVAAAVEENRENAVVCPRVA
ncbi:hypothetical protein HaLaN_16288 [Haematococcus lacustris]|uniref:Uncharacterized protein n=1 Tax=Haematococcus lacustris TaxID=44745 RepID=A0A699ZB13_HAELA|nr:hypothetical protein HaLaN_16288 [Haematococcus lacustris]